MNFTCQWGRVKRFLSDFYAAELQKHKPRTAEPGRECSTPDMEPCGKKKKKSIKKLELFLLCRQEASPQSLRHLGQVTYSFCTWVLQTKKRNLAFFPSSGTLMWFSAAGAGTCSRFGICAVSPPCKLIWYVSTTVVQTGTNCGSDGQPARDGTKEEICGGERTG